MQEAEHHVIPIWPPLTVMILSEPCCTSCLVMSTDPLYENCHAEEPERVSACAG